MKRLLPLLALLLSACHGPSDQEVGVALTAAAPFALLLSAFALWTLQRRPAYARQRRPRRAALGLGLLMHGLLALIAIICGGIDPLELIVLALICYGSAHLLLSLVLWRMGALFKTKHAAALSLTLSSVLLLPLCSMAALGFQDMVPWIEHFYEFLIVAGMGWFVPLVLWLGLFSETLLRKRTSKPRRATPTKGALSINA